MKQESRRKNQYLLKKEGIALVKHERNKEKNDRKEMMGYTEYCFQYLSLIFAKTFWV